ncbi:hypothetical protein APR04_003783 [Promicromonospora umidemergens]|nr:hypothetical protein [Promicromonospora umidemergens]MCP2284860.1 hypothetical protein [Promicromonospora umidemergens]
MTLDLTVRQAEILAQLQDAYGGITVYVIPGGNTDVADLHTYGPENEHLHSTGTTYSRVLYPLRDAGLLTIAEDRTTYGRLVKITDHGQTTLTARTSHGLPGIEARLQLAPSRAFVERFLDLGTDARRMARVLREIEHRLDVAQRLGGTTVPISVIRHHLKEISRG